MVSEFQTKKAPLCSLFWSLKCFRVFWYHSIVCHLFQRRANGKIAWGKGTQFITLLEYLLREIKKSWRISRSYRIAWFIPLVFCFSFTILFTSHSFFASFGIPIDRHKEPCSLPGAPVLEAMHLSNDLCLVPFVWFRQIAKVPLWWLLQLT